MKSKVFFFLFLCATTISAQMRTINVYFDSDSHELGAAEKQTIDNNLDTLHIEKIYVEGHTDNTADSMYNVRLSQRRAQSVKEYLIYRSIDANIIHIDYFGRDKPIADNQTSRGRQQNRRVDIVVHTVPRASLVAVQQPELEPEETPVITETERDPCKTDTTIILPGGARIIANYCEFLDLGGRLNVNPGNLSLNISRDGTTNNKQPCFKQAVKILLPVPESSECCQRTSFMYLTPRGWTLLMGNNEDIKTINPRLTKKYMKKYINSNEKFDTKINTINIDGTDYFQIEYNCASNTRIYQICTIDFLCKSIKFKTRRKYEIEDLTIVGSCPSSMNQWAGRRDNIYVAHIPCWRDDHIVSATMVNRRGERFVLQKQPLNDLTKRRHWFRYKKCYCQQLNEPVYHKYYIK